MCVSTGAGVQENVHARYSNLTSNQMHNIVPPFDDRCFSFASTLLLSFYTTRWSISSHSWVGLALIYDVPPCSSASSANLPSAKAEPGRRWNSQNHSQPNYPRRWTTLPCHGPPCLQFPNFLTSFVHFVYYGTKYCGRKTVPYVI